MTSPKGRPRRIEEDTRTYNILFPVSLLDKIHEDAKKRGVSSPVIIREAMEAYYSEHNDSAYTKGVLEACNKVRRTPKLRMRNAIGQTLGEIVAQQIEDELIDGPST